MKTVEGDLIALAKDARFDVIVHGCNCFCTMEAGIARIIAREFPAALQADRATQVGDRGKLGSISTGHAMFPGHRVTVVNAYTQFGYEPGGQLVDYDALSSCFDLIARDFGHMRIGYPMIGAGLAGGDWTQIAPRIDRALDGCDHSLVTLPKKLPS